MLKLKITVHANAFEFEGEVAFAELVGLVSAWLGLAVDLRDAQRTIDHLAARAGAANDSLQGAVDAHTPST